MKYVDDENKITKYFLIINNNYTTNLLHWV